MAQLRWAVAIHRREPGLEAELGPAICRCLYQLGHPAELVCDGDATGFDADVLLLPVNLTNFPEYCHRLQRGHVRRPVTVLWQMDPLPPTDLSPEAEQAGLAAARWNKVFRPKRTAAAMPRWKKLLTLIRLREWVGKQCSAPGYQRAWRLMQATPSARGDYDWRQVRGVMENWSSLMAALADNWLDHLAVSTQQRQRFLAARGIDSAFVPVGAYEELGRELGTQRDIAVAFLGSTKHGRRAALLAEFERSLARDGVRLERIEQDCFGEQRTALLNRTRILVNLHNYPWSPAWIRFSMAARCGALVVSEPSEDDQPFVAGRHYVACPMEEMPGTIIELLREPERCMRITQAAAELCQTELTLENSVQSLCALAAATKLSPAKT